MDARRFLTLTGAGLALCGCAGPAGPQRATAATNAARGAAPGARPAAAAAPAPPPIVLGVMAPIPNPSGPAQAAPPAGARIRAGEQRSPLSVSAPSPGARRPPAGRAAIASANALARRTSHAEGFVGGVQVFAYRPGEVYEIWTAPLRVTTLTLGRGETIVSKAAGDTVRWEIGETTSGQGASARAHVMIKPLARGLETNLVLATSQRIYLLLLKSGGADAFNTAVAWDDGAVTVATPPPDPPLAGAAAAPACAAPSTGQFRIAPRTGRPAWAPTDVTTDGVRTFLCFPPAMAHGEAPALFIVAPGGRSRLVNYRQQDGVWVVDQVLDQAELRLGARPQQVVRISRRPGARP